MSRVCPNCGSQVSDDSKFCMQCGTMMAASQVVAEAAAPVASVAEAVAPAPAVNVADSIPPVELSAPVSENIPNVNINSNVANQAPVTEQSVYAQPSENAQPYEQQPYGQQPDYSQANPYAQQPAYAQPAYAQQQTYNQQPTYAQPAYAQQNAAYEQQPFGQTPSYGTPVNTGAVSADAAGYATRSLIFGIIGLAVSFVGLVFAILAVVQSGNYTKLSNGIPSGKAKAGKIMGIIGIVLQGLLVFIYFIVFMAALLHL